MEPTGRMVARTIRKQVVEVSHMSDETRMERHARASEVLPWADPYIAGLLEKLRSSESTSPFIAPRWDRWHMASDYGPRNEYGPRSEQSPPLYNPYPDVELPRRAPAWATEDCERD